VPGYPHDLFFQDKGLTLIFAPPFVFSAVASPRTVQVLSPHREKSLVDCDPDGDRSPIYSGRFRWTDARKYVPRSQTAEIESLRGLPREVAQNSRSDVNAPPSGEADAARYFDYESAVALRTLAAAHGTAMPRYLLAPEVAVLLAAVTDLKRRLFIDTLWNTGGRLNEVLPLTGAPLSSPFVVLRTLKQRRGEDRRRQRGRGRPTREEQDADRAAQLNPRRAAHRSGLRAPGAGIPGHRPSPPHGPDLGRQERGHGPHLDKPGRL